MSEHKRGDIKIPGMKHYMLHAAPRKVVENSSLQEFNKHLGRSEPYANTLIYLKKKAFESHVIYDHLPSPINVIVFYF